jgi:hypothetical protein
MGSASEVNPLAILVSASAQADRAMRLDDQYWTDVGSGQDSEESEHSGFLMGVQAALDACTEAFGLGNTDSLTQLAGSLREFGNTSQDKIDYMREDDIQAEGMDEMLDRKVQEGIDGDEAVIVTVRVFGASEALAKALGRNRELWSS